MNIKELENLKKYAQIVDGKVVNISVWDGKTKWEPEEEIVEIPEDSYAGIGWDWDGKKFVDNRPTINYEVE
jgi:hypothetical protein